MNKNRAILLVLFLVIVVGVYITVRRPVKDSTQPLSNATSASSTQTTSEIPTDIAALEAELDAAVPRDLDKGFDDINLEIEEAFGEFAG